MKNIFKYAMLFVAACTMSMGFVACSSDDDDNNGNNESAFSIVRTAPLVDESSYPKNTVEGNYSKKEFGNLAMDACDELANQLVKANEVIGKSNLSKEQEAYLYKVLENVVDNVIVPTYTKLADDVEDLENTLNGLTTSTITQAQINKACQDFKAARENWERSEAFLGGAAADFDIDPTIDSWPLNRSLLLNYFNNGMNEEMLEDATILGFHALEFILFRNGAPRKVEEFKNTDTYTGFESITGEKELAYAQTICTLLKERTYQLQVAWEGQTSANADRVAVVRNAGLKYTTQNGLSFGDNMKKAGVSGSKSTFSSLKAAISQLLSDDEGSCFGICNEVGTAKIANPFANADIAYVESPYSYNSITDFSDNIRSIRNIWLGSTDRTANDYSFHTFFASVNKANVNLAVEGAYVAAIAGISNMPSPFVKYCSVVWGKNFDDPENWESITEEE